MTKINVDKKIFIGKIKPMNCVNNFPTMGTELDALVSELKIPCSRLHDTAFLNPHLVDVPSVFPNFEADENDEKSYDFAFTDYWIKHLYDLGIDVFYRLGVSIENYQSIKPYHIYPPKDYEKWARICEHIILHYNFGWANGFNYNIKYWEIWNEPDNFQEIDDNQMWKSSFEEYIKLYEISSKHLKGKFPELKIGGYSSCGFYAILEQKAVKDAKSSSRTEYFIECAEKFLEYAQKNCLPLDFFSWHSYSDTKCNVLYARYARELLDKFGFYDTESNLNEWNPWGTRYRGTLRDASNILSNMLALQNEPVDMLMYYDIMLTAYYCGVFNPLNSKKPFKAYYAFKAFSELFEISNQVKTENDDGDIFAISAYDGTKGVTVITNNSEQVKKLDINGIKIKEMYLISETEDFGSVECCNVVELKPFESIVIRFD